jgi:hypothetical protein
MTLNFILLFCDPIIIVNALVSCITCLEKKFRPLIISIAIGVIFSTNSKLCCHINPLLMKHADAFESRSHTIVDIPPFIMMGNKKQGVGFEDKVGPF